MIQLLLLAAVAQGYSLQQGVTPVQKVIQMLNEMSAKGMEEKAAEQETFGKYKIFCANTIEAKGAAIEKATEDIALLQADIQKALSDADVAANTMAELDAKLAELEASKANAKKVREEDRATYVKASTDATATVEAVQRGIQSLQAGKHEPSMLQAMAGEWGHDALLQVSQNPKVPLAYRRLLASFITQPSNEPDPMAVAAPEAAAYEFQSGGLVEMLKKLSAKFLDEKHAIETEEMKQNAAYEVIKANLEYQIKSATEDREMQASTKAAREMSAAESKAELEETQRSKAEDEKYLATLKSECEMAASDFENRQQLRDEEMEAIAKAVEILQSGSVSGMADKHLPALNQAFPLLRASQPSTTSQVAGFLKARAEKSGSKLLSMVAQKVSEDPIAKVKQMMKDMIVRLMEQASEEADHKGWCDTEMSSNKITRDTKTEGVAALTTQRDKLNADLAKLAEQVADLTKAIAEIDGAVAQATIDRNEEAAKNKETIEDAKEAQLAVTQALSVLKDFYRKAATATSFAQTKKEDPDPSSPFKKPYTGMGGESGGVLGMLEVIGSDFARLQSDTETAEAQSYDEFGKFSVESSKDKSVKNADMQNKINTEATKKSTLTDTVNDMKAMQGELDSALVYFDKLKPSCVATKTDYNERVARRNAEVQGLEEALAFFNGDAIAPVEAEEESSE
jgi:hypothetical protein